MKKIVFIIVSFLFSASGYCQKIYRSFYTKRLPRVTDNNVFKVQNRNNSIGLIIGNSWYPISKDKDSKNSSYQELWYAYFNKSHMDSINVYKPGLEDQYSYTLILSPSQKDSFMNNTNNLHFSHASHVSHRSHYSSAK